MNLTAATTQMNRGGSQKAFPSQTCIERLDGRQVSSISKPGTRSNSAANHCAPSGNAVPVRRPGGTNSARCRNVKCVQFHDAAQAECATVPAGIAARSCTTLCGPAQQVIQDRLTQWADGVLDLREDALGGRGPQPHQAVRCRSS